MLPTALHDHDFDLHGIVPSVVFVLDVPEDPLDTFFRGHAFVTRKDKVSQPSNALRHSTEMTSLIRSHYSEDGLTSSQPIAIVVSDGGPDLRVTFWICLGCMCYFVLCTVKSGWLF